MPAARVSFLPLANPQDCSAPIFRGYRTALERHGLLDRVREAVPPGTRSLLERPPLAIAWVSDPVMNDVFVALEKTSTPEAVLEVKGEVGRAELRDDKRVARIPVRWS